MSALNRRDFIKLAAAGATASGLALLPSPCKADYVNLTYKLHGDGWDDYGRRDIIAAAMNIVGKMGQSSVLAYSERLSRGSYKLTGGVWDRTNLNSYYSNLGYKDVLRYQVLNLSVASERPIVNIHPYLSDDFDWGRANLDLVTVKFTSTGFNVEGEFDIELNHKRLGGSGIHSSPSAWAGVICHEMLHNLGHRHDPGEYSSSLQINALQQAVKVAGGGGESINAARQCPCGGRSRS